VAAPKHALHASWACDTVVATIGTVSQNCVALVGQALPAAEIALQEIVMLDVVVPPGPLAVSV
jgi:hypothetical protein